MRRLLSIPAAVLMGSTATAGALTLFTDRFEAHRELIFEAQLETAKPPYGFDSINDYQDNDAAYHTGERVFDPQFASHVWKETFHDYCNDSYFGLRARIPWQWDSIHWQATVRFGDADTAYTWQTTGNSDPECGQITGPRTHELKFPDIGGGQTPNDRIIGKWRSDGSFLVYTERAVPLGEPPNHSVDGFRMHSGEIHTIEFAVIDNGPSGDIVRIWIDNDDPENPDYEYISTGNIIGSDEWAQPDALRFDHGYRNHNPPHDQTFYFDDVRIDIQFIGTQ